MFDFKIEKVEFGEVGDDLFYYPLNSLDSYGFQTRNLPSSLKVILESLLRHYDSKTINFEHFKKLLGHESRNDPKAEVPFYVSRIVMHDLGLGNLIDLGTLRDVAVSRGFSDPLSINPILPVEIVIDHSVQVDYYGTPDAFELNQKSEFARNRERYEFIKWISKTFKNVRVLPPSIGIIHQINLEYLSTLVTVSPINGGKLIFPDSLVGLDSHTAMINGAGILGWGVGGIEGMAAMLGEPISIRVPDIVAVKLKGKPGEGVLATDIVLTLTKVLRENNVVNKFVEFIGNSVSELDVFDRATISNMCPEYGATVGLFPIDNRTLEFLKLTGRDEKLVDLVKKYYTKMDMFGTWKKENEYYSEVIEFDLSEIEPSLAGPNLPSRRISFSDLPSSFKSSLAARDVAHSNTAPNSGQAMLASAKLEGKQSTLTDGDIVIASVTSCTNTANPKGMIGAGIIARNAYEKGLHVNPLIKTSMAPGSRVVEKYLKDSGLQQYLDKIGFNVTGFGCMTCGGKGGSMAPEIEETIAKNGLNVAAITSSNRNFEARTHRLVRTNYITSPQMTIAMALFGTVLRDPSKDPIGNDTNGSPVYLKDIWPKDEEIEKIMSEFVTNESYRKAYQEINAYSKLWDGLNTQTGVQFKWDPESTYIKPSPFFEETWKKDNSRPIHVRNGKILLVLGDNISTDHICPESTIPKESPAGQYLLSLGVPAKNLDTYASRRGNPEVKARGTFSKDMLKNKLVDREGGYTKYFPTNETVTVFDAAERYKETGAPLVVFGGKNYGMGSSRDWAAKGTALIGVQAIIAKSFERIHRENLVCMGVLPLEFRRGEGYETLDIDPSKDISLELPANMDVNATVILRYQDKNSKEHNVKLITRLDTKKDVTYYLSGGIMPYVLNNLIDH
jgi:aconitate hydratase